MQGKKRSWESSLLALSPTNPLRSGSYKGGATSPAAQWSGLTHCPGSGLNPPTPGTNMPQAAGCSQKSKRRGRGGNQIQPLLGTCYIRVPGVRAEQISHHLILSRRIIQKLRFREEEQLARGHTVSKRWSQGSSSVPLLSPPLLSVIRQTPGIGLLLLPLSWSTSLGLSKKYLQKWRELGQKLELLNAQPAGFHLSKAPRSPGLRSLICPQAPLNIFRPRNRSIQVSFTRASPTAPVRQLRSSAPHRWVVKSKGRVPKWPLWSLLWLLSPLGQYLSPFPVPGDISGNLLVGAVDKNNGVRAGHIAASDNRKELQAEGPEHRVCQERGCQDLHSGERGHRSAEAWPARCLPAQADWGPRWAAHCTPLPTHKRAPRVCIELQCLMCSCRDYLTLHFANGF